MSIPRVNSAASELNDFRETDDGQKIYNVSKSRLMKLVNWVEVIRAYLPVALAGILALLMLQLLFTLYSHRFDFQSFMTAEVAVVQMQKPFVFDLGWKSVALLAVLVYYASHRVSPVYLIDFTTFEPPAEWKLTQEEILEAMKRSVPFTEDSMDFMKRMLQQSGVGNASAWPPGVTATLRNENFDESVEMSRKEAEIVMFDCVKRLLANTKIKAKDIDILVVNCSLFSPTPSLCTMIVNEFGLRTDIKSYNLSGMGCSASVISIDLARNILTGHPNSTALIVSTEIITPNLYHGDERSFLLQNTLFRCGGAAMLLSNKWTDVFRARFKLLHCVRTQYVSSDSYGCVFEAQDEKGNRGVRLSKDIVKVAGRAMEKNLTSLGPYVLPLSEQIKTAVPMVLSMISKNLNKLGLKLPKVSPYIPDFKRGIDHFCIHAGGRGVIDGIEKNLNLFPKHVEASRYVLYTYGNTSSSSIWYELDYTAKNMDLKRGQRVLQLAFGSGFKCNTCVWLCMKNDRVKEDASPSKKKSE